MGRGLKEETEREKRKKRSKKKKKKGREWGSVSEESSEGEMGYPTNLILTLDSFSVGFLKDLLLIQAFLGLSIFVGSEEE